jgi:hypothetical protein
MTRSNAADRFREPERGHARGAQLVLDTLAPAQAEQTWPQPAARGVPGPLQAAWSLSVIFYGAARGRRVRSCGECSW